MSFRLVPKSVTLNDLERRNGRYFALFQRILVASGRTAYKFTFVISSPDEFLFKAVSCHNKQRVYYSLYSTDVGRRSSETIYCI